MCNAHILFKQNVFKRKYFSKNYFQDVGIPRNNFLTAKFKGDLPSKDNDQITTLNGGKLGAP